MLHDFVWEHHVSQLSKSHSDNACSNDIHSKNGFVVCGLHSAQLKVAWSPFAMTFHAPPLTHPFLTRTGPRESPTLHRESATRGFLCLIIPLQ